MQDDTELECRDCNEETTYAEAEKDGILVSCPDCGGDLRQI